MKEQTRPTTLVAKRDKVNEHSSLLILALDGKDVAMAKIDAEKKMEELSSVLTLLFECALKTEGVYDVVNEDGDHLGEVKGLTFYGAFFNPEIAPDADFLNFGEDDVDERFMDYLCGKEEDSQ